MWDSIGQGMAGNGKGKVVFVQRLMGPRSIWIPTESVRYWGSAPELGNSD